MYEMCLSQYLAQSGFCFFFLGEAVLSAIWVTRTPVFPKGQNEPLAGAEELLKEGEVQGEDAD